MAPEGALRLADRRARRPRRRADLTEAWIHYYHPVGTCKMGPADDPAAVVDPRCRIHGLEGGYVADCAIIPVVPRANTNIPAVMIAERLATWM